MLLCAAGAVAQTTHVVTTWAGIPAAIASANPGDVLLLPNTGTPGTDYGPFTLDKPLTIRGSGCRIGSSQQQGGTGPVSVLLSAGERAHLEGLDLTHGHSTFGNVGTQLDVQGGTVTVHDCSIAYGVEHAVRIDQAAVVFDHCTITAFGFLGAGAGIAANGAQVTVRDTVVTGADAAQSPSPLPFQPAMAAALLWPGTSLHAERSTFLGGNHAQTIFSDLGAPGIQITSLGANVHLAEVTAIGGNSNSSIGGAGIDNAGPIACRIWQTTLQGGQPGGQASTGTPPVADTMTRLAITPALQRGQTSTFVVDGAPGAAYGILLAFDAAPSLLQGIVEPIWLQANAPLFSGALDGSGQNVVQVPIPNLTATLEVHVWFQAVSGVTWPAFHVSTLAGGRVR